MGGAQPPRNAAALGAEMIAHTWPLGYMCVPEYNCTKESGDAPIMKAPASNSVRRFRGISGNVSLGRSDKVVKPSRPEMEEIRIRSPPCTAISGRRTGRTERPTASRTSEIS